MPDPLPMCRELAREMVDEYISDQHEDIVAALFDARVRPLAYLLQRCHIHIVDSGNSTLAERIDAALKAAGAE